MRFDYLHDYLCSTIFPLPGVILLLSYAGAIVLQDMSNTVSRFGVRLHNFEENMGNIGVRQDNFESKMSNSISKFELRLDSSEMNIGRRLDNIETSIVRLNCKLLEMNSHLVQLIGSLPDKVNLAVERSYSAQVYKQQLHLQRKQDQLASKQDLMHTTMMGETFHMSLPVISSPPPSVRLSTSSPQGYFRSPPPSISGARDSYSTRPRRN